MVKITIVFLSFPKIPFMGSQDGQDVQVRAGIGCHVDPEQGGRQDLQSEGALFSDDVIMTSLLLDFNP